MNTNVTTFSALLLVLLVGLPAGALAQDTDNEGDQVTPETPETEIPDEGPNYPGQQIPPEQAMQSAQSRETVCNNGTDDDGDAMIDCADSDCFEQPACVAGGQPERTDELCSDWIDNDSDGIIDCDDTDCQSPTVTVCQGSNRHQQGHDGVLRGGQDELPSAAPGRSLESYIGTDGDQIGESNDILCADGIDNDNDGRTDCDDYECRFSTDISVCHGTPGLKFSVVAGVGASVDVQHLIDAGDDPTLQTGEAFDVRFTRLQLRALGSIPFIEDSFFLVNARLERSPRITFALFQFPISDMGHFLAVNSGNGNLSTGLIVSTHKQPLLDPPGYLFRPFEQGNGATLEFGGPLTTTNLLRFRTFAAGGSGSNTGNVGGRFFRGDDRNFSFAAGAQLHINAINQFDRFDTAFLYEPVPLTLGFALGGMYSQRPRERFPAVNAFGVFKWAYFTARAETYIKRELEFGAWQVAWNVMAGAILVPSHLFFAADIGSFYATEFEDAPVFDSSLQRPLDELQFRAALHWYIYRQNVRLSLLYAETHLEVDPDRPLDPTTEREIRLESIFRF